MDICIFLKCLESAINTVKHMSLWIIKMLKPGSWKSVVTEQVHSSVTICGFYKKKQNVHFNVTISIKESSSWSDEIIWQDLPN